MRLRPFFLYRGAKWSSARYYPTPKYKMLIEPFAGAAGYAVHYYDRNVRLYDIDERIVSVWDYLIRVKPRTIRALPARVEHVGDLKCCPEARLLISLWLSRCAGFVNRRSAWGRDPRYKTIFWGEEIRERIAVQVPYIKHWKVRHVSFENVPRRCRATWFVDPPYHRSGRSSYSYAQIDYSNLASWCRELQGQVIVCEQEGARWLPFKFFKTTRGMSNGEPRRPSHEMLWYRET